MRVSGVFVVTGAAEAGDPASLAAGLERLLDSPDESASRVHKGREWAARFRWDGAARAMRQILLEAAGSTKLR